MKGTGSDPSEGETLCETDALSWNSRPQIYEVTWKHTAIGIQNFTAIPGSCGLFKDKWGTSALVLKGVSHNIHGTTARITAPGRSQDHEAYRS